MRPVEGELPSKADLFHLLIPNGVVESYRITSVHPENAPKARIEVEGPPGLEIRAPENAAATDTIVKYLYYPGSGYAGQPKWRVTTNGQAPCRSTR